VLSIKREKEEISCLVTEITNKMGITNRTVIQVMARIDLLGSKEATIFEGEKDMMKMKVKPK